MIPAARSGRAPRRSARRASVLLGASLLSLGLRATPAAAQGDLVPAPVLAVGANEAALSRRIDLTQGRSLVVDLPQDAKEVFVANPKVANAVVRSTRKVFIIGIDNGATSIFIMNAEGRQIAALDVTVGRDLNVLRQTLAASLAGARIDVRPAGDSIVLSGVVANASEAQQAVDVANAFVGIGAARGAVINNLTIRGKDQVMLRVTVVEVARNVIKQFGINTSASWSGFNFTNGAPFALNGALTPSGINSLGASEGNNLTGGFNHAGITAKATLRAFEQAGVSRILAEPTLTAISGEAAKFTAGGEIPVPSSQNCTGVGTGCQVGIEYKPYGVALNFTPVVLSENRISIRVGTSVTEIDPTRALPLSNGGITVSVPATTTRSSETTVELPSGAVMMTAGLIQQKSQQAINGLPGLVNLPILGALFRSRDYQRQETELVIMVTPFIAKPMDNRQATRPDDGFTDVHDAKAVLLGRLNKLYGTVGGSPLGAGYRGRVGFITD